MFRNDDPIKEYKSFRFRNREEKLNVRDFAPTDLHECSTDLSDEASRKEEIEHAKFANYVRERKLGNTYYQEKYDKYEKESKDKKVKKKNNINAIIFVVIILAGILSTISEVVEELEGINFQEEIYEMVEEKYEEIQENIDVKYEVTDEEKYEPITEAEFEIYKSNIALTVHKIADGSSIIQMYNTNDKSFSNAKITVIFYDEIGSVLKIEDVHVNLLIAKNEQFLKLYEAPSEYYRYDYIIENSYGKYSDISKEQVNLNIENNGLEGKITINNNDKKDIDNTEVTISYFKENTLIEVENYYFFNLEIGKEQSKNFYLYNETEVDEIRINLNDVRIY